MSNTIVMMPPEKTDWRIDPGRMAEEMKRRWPQAHIEWTRDSDPASAFDFEWDTEDYHVVGSFGRNGRSLFLSRSTQEDLAAMAVWFRSLVPPSQPLVVWSGSGENCALTPDMTQSDFLRDFK